MNRTIMLIDDDRDLLEVLAERCRQMGWQVMQARNLLTATSMIDEQTPDMVCVDVNMPTGNGLRFCEMLMTDPHTASMPVIVLTGRQDAETQQTCERLGLHYLAKRPDMWPDFETLVRTVAVSRKPNPMPRLPVPRPMPSGMIPPWPEATDPQDPPATMMKKQVVVVDSDTDMAEMLSRMFRSLGCSVMTATSGAEARIAIERMRPDLMCIEANMPGRIAQRLCKMMAANQRTRMTPVIVMTGSGDAMIERCGEMMMFRVEKGRDICGRIEPLVMELLSLDEAHTTSAMQEVGSQRSREGSPDTAYDADDALIDIVYSTTQTNDQAAPVQPPNVERAPHSSPTTPNSLASPLHSPRN